jgi:LuxR family maltose regulon positive regulatory protein
VTAATSSRRLVLPALPPGHVPRHGIARLLDASADVPLTVVRGPWCSGKTVALAAWARSHPEGVAWATLDHRDRDPLRLATLLGAAVGWRGRSPEGDRSRSDDHGDTEAEAEFVVEAVLDHVVRRGRATTLVLDGADAIRASRGEELLTDVIDHVPPELHVVCSTVGTLPGAAARRRRLAGQVVLVEPEHLVLTPEETVALLGAARGRPVATSDAAEVHVRAEGAVAVVAAAARAGVPLAAVADDDGWLEDVLWTLLDRLRPDLAVFVREIAALPSPTGALCDAVTGRRGSSALLDELEEVTGLVVTGADGRRRLHRALGPAILRLVERRDPDLPVGTRRAAAHWWERQGQPREAVDEWLAAGDHGQAWALIGRHLLEAYFAGGRPAVEHWAEAPPPTGVRDPWHAVDRAGLLLLAGRVDEAVRWLADARTWAQLTGEEELLLPAIDLIRPHCDYLQGDLEAALARWPAELPDDRDLRARLVAASVRVDILAHLGQHDEAERAFEEVTPSAVFTGPLAPVVIHSTQATLARTRGRLVQAITCADQALELAEGTVGREGPGTEAAHLALGVAHLERGQVVEAVRDLAIAHRITRRTGATHLSVGAALALARARGLQGRRAEALQLVEGARRPLHLHPLPDLLRRWIDRTELRLHLLAGDRAEVERVVAGWSEPPVPAEDVVLQAWSALAVGDRARAQDLLRPEVEGPLSVATAIELELLRARATGDVVRTRGHVARAVRMGAADGYLTVFVDHRGDLLPALQDLRAVEPSPYLADLLFVVDQEVSAALVERLTDREVAVLASLQSSRPIEAIAADLDVTVNTLKTHVKAIYRKLGVASRADAVHRAIVLRIIGPEADDDDAPELSGASTGPGTAGDR